MKKETEEKVKEIISITDEKEHSICIDQSPKWLVEESLESTKEGIINKTGGKKMEEKTTEQFYKESEPKIKRIADEINKTESPLNACESVIFDLLFNMELSYFEILGLLEEIKLRFREASIAVMKEAGIEVMNEEDKSAE